MPSVSIRQIILLEALGIRVVYLNEKLIEVYTSEDVDTSCNINSC